MKKIIVFATFISFHFITNAQLNFTQKMFTHADTLRGSNTPERAWWDVLRYDIIVKPDYATKTIEGKNIITFKSLLNPENKNDLQLIKRIVLHQDTLKMQIDLQKPLIVDSIKLVDSIDIGGPEGKRIYRGIKEIKLQYVANENVVVINFPENHFTYSQDKITIYYHGTPREAVKPPWDGGWIWTKDSLGRPWMTAAVQGLGASAWYPCKDIQSDEPDNGASLTVIVPETLMCVANGRMDLAKKNNDGTTTYKWEVKNTINNYDIIPYIGYYKNFSEVYKGEKGNLDVNYWALDYDVNRFKSHVQPDVQRMLKAFEYWMGPYPFYEDGYKIIEAPHLGMEHQSAIAYGNKFLQGYSGRDRSGTGQGLKWDFIVVHESGHEWFGNNITSKDIADMWIHEAFTTYSETLFTEYYYGKEAGNEYNVGQRKIIKNDEPIIGHYGVNEEGSADEYEKGTNMINTIRHSMNNDEKFRSILRGLNVTFYHQTVTSEQVENYISQQAGFNYSKVFEQYLTTTQIPEFNFYFSADKKKVFYKWDSCVAGFNLPLVLKSNDAKIKIYPTTEWKSAVISTAQIALFNPAEIEFEYYIKTKRLSKKKNN